MLFESVQLLLDAVQAVRQVFDVGPDLAEVDERGGGCSD